MKYTDFFWDFDGTLFDTYPRVNRAIQNALKDTGVSASIETIAPLAKVTIGHALRVLCPQRSQEAMACYRAHAEEEGYDSMRPYPGAERLLQSICAHGGRNYLYTHRDRSGLAALRHYRLDRYFTDAVTSEDGFPSKPAPDALLHLMEKHRLNAADCIMLGDRDIDLGSGVNAGMACALFDPDHYYDHYETAYRYTSLFDLMADLVWEQRPEDLCLSDQLFLQRRLQEKHPEWGSVDPERALRQLLWLVGELGEVIDVVKKVEPSHLTETGLPRRRLTEELADVAMYLNDVLCCYDISAAEFAQAYYGKMRRNLQRDWQAEHQARYGV